MATVSINSGWKFVLLTGLSSFLEDVVVICVTLALEDAAG